MEDKLRGGVNMTAMPPASATCPSCGRNVLVRRDGYIWKHRTDTARRAPLCPASGELVWHAVLATEDDASDD